MSQPALSETQQSGVEMRHTEFWFGRSGISFGVTEKLFEQESDYQRVEVFETDGFGRLLTLDGLVMLTERDEFVYHEMIAHPALCLHPDPRRVLVVGGGDGGTVREVLRHARVEHVDLVEIDGAVVEASRRFFPAVASALGHEKLTLHVADGIRFVQDAPSGSYDVILIDSTDPVGFAEGLFGRPFYRACARLLGADGILVAQTESPFGEAFLGHVEEAQGVLGELFPHVRTYQASIPTYPMGLWAFSLAAKTLDPVADFDPEEAERRLAGFGEQLRYYHAALHRAAFVLPAFARRRLA